MYLVLFGLGSHLHFVVDLRWTFIFISVRPRVLIPIQVLGPQLLESHTSQHRLQPAKGYLSFQLFTIRNGFWAGVAQRRGGANLCDVDSVGRIPGDEASSEEGNGGEIRTVY